MRLLLLFLLLPALARSAPESGVTCGHAFRDLLRLCGHPDLSTPASCCPAIRQYNDALCWCQPTAFALAASLATNFFAFVFRAETCNVTAPLRPAISQRDIPPTKDTCPKDFVSLSPDDATEGCDDPRTLRRSRQNALTRLDGLNLADASAPSVAAFRQVVNSLFVEGVSFNFVGMASGFGRDIATDLLLARQSVLGAPAAWVPPQSRAEVFDKFWREAKVSYRLEFASPDGRTSYRSMFVSFESCSEKILEVYAVDDAVVRFAGEQFYYPSVPRDAVSMYNRTPEQICKQVTRGCAKLSPYESLTDCVTFMAGLKKARKVMCNRFDKEEVSVLALLGDTTSCRYSYALAAKADPERYCPLLGKEATGLCSESLCSADEFEDIFTAENPKYEQSSGFLCKPITASEGECTELWPRDV